MITRTSEKPFPFRPESTERLRLRYAAALDPVVEVDPATGEWPAIDPAEARRHIFDHLDGLRLVVSRERAEGVVSTHFSASVMPGWSCHRRIAAMLCPLHMFECYALEAIESLSGADRSSLRFSGYTRYKHAPEWVVVEPEGGAL